MRAVNLLPPDLRSGPKGPAPAVASGVENSGGTGAFIVLGVLAFCVFALAAYVLAGNTVKDRRADLAQATAQAESVTKRAAELKPYADFETVVNERVQTVKDLAASRFDWEQAIRDLSRAVPANVTLANFKGDLGSEQAGGNSIRTAITAPAITLVGCTSSQTAVATLMARLRTIDGVTRVSLAKSDKEATEGATGTADVNAPSATGYCGRSGAPSFEVVTFFEGHAAASTDPTPGGAPATTTPTTATGTTPATPAATPAAGATPAATPAAGTATPAATPAAGSASTTSATTP